MSAPAIVVTGLGARTSVGRDVVQTAAAVRAGIDRFRAWNAFPVRAHGEPVLNVAPLGGRISEEAWTEKLFPLLPMTTREALARAELDPSRLRGRRVRGYLAVPDRARAGDDPAAVAACLAHLDELWFDGAFGPGVISTHAFDQAGGVHALAAAVADLGAGRADVALVAGVDSWLHVDSLLALYEAGRLKTTVTPDGLIPGEAAAVLVLERAEAAAQRRAPVKARIGAIAITREAAPLALDRPIRAEAMTEALVRLFAEEDPARIHGAYVDLSGERWRSLEWSLVETRCLSRMAYGWKLHHPADCLGDVGAATGPLLIALVTRAFSRGYAGPGALLVATTAAEGTRAAVVLHPPAVGAV